MILYIIETISLFVSNVGLCCRYLNVQLESMWTKIILFTKKQQQKSHPTPAPTHSCHKDTSVTKRAEIWGLVGDVYCILATFHVVSWVRCGTLWYRFMYMYVGWPLFLVIETVKDNMLH